MPIYNLCDNGIRVKREIAEGAILENVKIKLLSDEVIAHITEQLQAALRDLENKPDDSGLLSDKLRIIEAKLKKLTDAIESVGISETLANRLTVLKQEKTDTEAALERVPAPVKFLPELLPALIQRWQELVLGIEDLAQAPTPR